jgi:hypothetical protein
MLVNYLNRHLLEVDAALTGGLLLDNAVHVIDQIQVPRVFLVDFLQHIDKDEHRNSDRL